MFETILVKFLGYCVFWSSDARRRFRAGLRQQINRLRKTVLWKGFRQCRKLVLHKSTRPLPKSQGERLVEDMILLFGVSVYRRRRKRDKYRVAVLVDEFFGGWDTAIGGYGALARKYVCRYIPSNEIEIDVLLEGFVGPEVLSKVVDQTVLYRLPSNRQERQEWLERQAYDLFLSIEMTWPSFEILREYSASTRLLFWVQDPRELATYQSRLQKVSILKDGDWGYTKDVATWMQEMLRQRRIYFISQGESLSTIARATYQIPNTVPIQDLPNPVEINFEYKLNDPPRENKIIFLGRLEAQKRVWIVCEIAKAMPQYEFYILGATGKGRNEDANARTLEPYRNPDGSSKIKNLHFVGHVDGEVKNYHIKTAKLLLNTSVWEGIPVSWLEALSYGTLVVSAFDRDKIVERFGTFVGEVFGDGTDAVSIGKFTPAIDYWMTHESERNAIAQEAIAYVRGRHSIDEFTRKMRTAIVKTIP
jgi:glycosyltransferase involved in cell wall biosynthesis